MSFTPLLQALARGALVLTPTNRLQRDILWLYNQSSSTTVIAKPKCLTYGNWLNDWFENYCFEHPEQSLPGLIDNWQFQLLWKRHYPRALKHFEMQQIMGVIKNCAVCLSPPQGSDFLYTPLAQEFQTTWQAVDKVLKQNNWLAPHQLASLLATLPYPQAHETPEIIWACFDYLHPEQQLIYQHLQSLNIKQHFYDFNCEQAYDNPQYAIEQVLKAPKQNTHYLFKAEDDQVEYQQLIHWIKTLWGQGINRIGVVVPDLSQEISYLRRCLTQHLPQEHLHFSLGQALTDFPIVQHGLALLNLDINKRLTRHQCRLLLHTPFIEISLEESLKRQKIYQTHPLLQEPELSFVDFIRACESKCPNWCSQLKQIKTLPKTASLDEWIVHLQKRWQAFGFPGKQVLDDNNQKILEKFYNTLMQLHNGQSIVQHYTQEELLAELTQLCREQIHQPPQNYHGIHIMGWLESSGFSGQALWICHLQSQLLPQAVQFSPTLPLAWQKQKQLPRTDNTKEFQLAKQMLYRLMHGQEHVVLSFADLKQQQVQWPSPILPDGLREFIPAHIPLITPKLETIEDEFIVPVTEHTPIRGSTGQLSQHGKCPFKAFAQSRLNTEQSGKEQFGLSALEQGDVLHRILHQLWLKLDNQNTLLSLSQEELKELVDQTIKEQLASFATAKPYSLDSICYDLEIELLIEKILQVVELDKQRPYFKINGLEQEHTLSLMDQSFKMRFDRIDELADGSKVLIDYKLNTPSPLPWYQSRPFHPQMLMYGLSDKNLQALMFVPINKSKDKPYKANGISANALEIDGVSTSKCTWAELQQQWQISLETFVQEIQTGFCAPTPSSNACLHCIHHDLCRVQLELDTEESS